MYKTCHEGRACQRGEAQRQLLALASLAWLCGSALPAAAEENSLGSPRSSPSILRKVSDLSDKLELTTNTSRILTLDKRIPFVQVNNPELLVVTPLSDKQVQVSAKKPGVTQVNLKDEDKATLANRRGFDCNPPLANPIDGPVHVEGTERGDLLCRLH